MVVGGDFSATGLARPVCIEVAENPGTVLRALQKVSPFMSTDLCITLHE
jgi:hypothetical protein